MSINKDSIKKNSRHSRMYYIWCDESDSEGAFYSNFYGGMLIRSMDLHRVLKLLKEKVEELHLEREEIKWQKVNKRMLAPYLELVNLIFDLLDEDLIKIRIKTISASPNFGFSVGCHLFSTE